MAVHSDKNKNVINTLQSALDKSRREKAQQQLAGTGPEDHIVSHAADGQQNQQQQNNAPGGANSLFGTTSTQPPNNTTTNATGLFGNSNQPQNPQPANSGGLFGGGTGQPPASSGSGSLFGGGTATAGGGFAGGTQSLFGTNPTNQQPATNSLFAKPATNGASSMFGGTAARPFAAQSQPQPQQQQQQQQQPPSLLGSVMQNQMNRGAPYGQLSMGQGASAPGSSVSATKIDLATMRSTTRFEDCIDPIRAELEKIDKMIQLQESYCKQIEAMVQKHDQDVGSLNPDVDYVRDKIDTVEQALIADAHGVEAQRVVAQKDRKDVERSGRIVQSLQLPDGYHFTNVGMNGYHPGSQANGERHRDASSNQDANGYDTDLIGNYFIPTAAELHRAVSNYAGNLTEIENHMRVIESSAVAEAQLLAARKAGIDTTSRMTGDGTVRELADTLRGFEESILGVAGAVGECREGVNELTLGRLRGRSGRY